MSVYYLKINAVWLQLTLTRYLSDTTNRQILQDTHSTRFYLLACIQACNVGGSHILFGWHTACEVFVKKVLLVQL